tara:strand:+ start:616 stop:933 length:318 start_codon:yes stop_codon:yes gene_type:complete
MEQVRAINQDLHLYLENNTKNAGIKSLERIKRMPIKKPKKLTKKDILYHIALIRQDIFKLHEKTMLIESVINKYIKMKKDTDKFNKFLQDEIKGAKSEKAKKAKK